MKIIYVFKLPFIVEENGFLDENGQNKKEALHSFAKGKLFQCKEVSFSDHTFLVILNYTAA